MIVYPRFPCRLQHMYSHTFPFTFLTGVILLAAGLLGALGIFQLYPAADMALRVVTVAVIVGYGILLMNAQKKYLVGITK